VVTRAALMFSADRFNSINVPHDSGGADDFDRLLIHMTFRSTFVCGLNRIPQWEMEYLPLDNGARRLATLVGRATIHTDLPTGEAVAIYQKVGEESANLKILQESDRPESRLESQP